MNPGQSLPRYWFSSNVPSGRFIDRERGLRRRKGNGYGLFIVLLVPRLFLVGSPRVVFGISEVRGVRCLESPGPLSLFKTSHLLYLSKNYRFFVSIP